MTAQKQRQSNIELFRIITMLLIVAHHYVVNSGLMELIGSQPFCAKSLFYYVFGAWGKAGINGFVLITGYFMCRSEISVRKYLKLYLEVLFYRLGIYLLFSATGMDAFSLRRALLMVLPFSSLADNFTGCFLAFYLLIPFLNLALTRLSKKVHLCLILLLLLFYTILGTVPSFEVRFSYVSWFIVIYLIGAYIRFYDPKALHHQIGKKLLAAIVLVLGSIVVFAYLKKRFGVESNIVTYFLTEVNRPFALLTAVLAFSYFRQLKIGYHSWINTIAASTFGVLLIHANSETMRHWLWGTLLHNKQMYDVPYGVLLSMVSVLGVFLVCSVIDILRIQLLERSFFRFYDRHEKRIIPNIGEILSQDGCYVNRGGGN